MVRLVAIARVELVRLFRDRSNLFFVLVLPLLLVVLIGAQFGGSFDTRIGVVANPDDPAAAELLASIGAVEGFVVVEVDDPDEVRDRVARNRLAAGLVLPDDYGAALAMASPTEVAFVGRPDATAVSIRQVVEAAIADQAAVSAAAAAVADLGFGEATDLVPIARDLRAELPQLSVRTDAVGGDDLAREFAGLGQFDLGASTQLFLFTFLTALTGSAALIQTRTLGVATRMVSTPTSVGVLLGGQAAGRIAVALFQAIYIIAATLLLFRVDWGDPLATGAVIVVFSIAAGSAGMLIGAVASNDTQASGLGIGLGIGLAALGGSMIPLEVYPPAARTVAFLTPHAWANEAMAEIVRRDGGLADVLVEVGVLAGFAGVLFVIAAWRLRRVLTR